MTDDVAVAGVANRQHGVASQYRRLMASVKAASLQRENQAAPQRQRADFKSRRSFRAAAYGAASGLNIAARQAAAAYGNAKCGVANGGLAAFLLAAKSWP